MAIAATFEQRVTHDGAYPYAETAKPEWAQRGRDAFHKDVPGEPVTAEAAHTADATPLALDTALFKHDQNAVQAVTGGNLGAGLSQGVAAVANAMNADSAKARDEKKDKEGSAQMRQALSAQQQLQAQLDDLMDEWDAINQQLQANKQVLALAKAGKLDRDNPEHVQLIIAAGLDPADDDATLVDDAERQIPALEDKLEDTEEKLEGVEREAAEQGLEVERRDPATVEALTNVIHEQGAEDVAADIRLNSWADGGKSGLEEAGDDVHQENEQAARTQTSSFDFGGMG